MKPNIFFNISENSGVGYYRQFLCAQALKESGQANVLINDFTWGETRILCKIAKFPDCDFLVSGYDVVPMLDTYVQHLKDVHNYEATDADKQKFTADCVSMIEPTIEQLAQIGGWADLIVFGRRDVPEYLAQWEGMREFYNIPIVVDTDDNVRATRPFNPGYRGYYPGAPSIHWNAETMKKVNAITVSTENLRNVHLKDNPNIYVLPNSLEFDRWAKAPKPEHEEIRIGLLVSSAHHEDVMLLKDVIPVIIEKYPNVHFYYTMMFDYVFQATREKFPERLHPIPWIPLKTWPEEVVSYGFDIGLAPLVDNFFNRAKSNLRFLEYSAAKMATVASPVEPYKCIEHGVTGLLSTSKEQWIDQISLLIDDKAQRTQIATNAFKYVAQYFDVKKTAKYCLIAYNKIIRAFKKTNGKRKFPRNDFFPVSSLN